MKRIFKNFLVIVTTALLALGVVGCGNIEDNHVCRYGFESVGVQDNIAVTGYSHDLEKASSQWTSNKAEPTFFTYHMLDSCTFEPKSVVIGENVYVGICESGGTINFSNTTFSLPSSGKGGVFVYNCAPHGCYHYLDEALPISEDYLDYALLMTNLKGNENHDQAFAQLKALKEGTALTEGETVALAPLTVPAGTYSFGEAFDLTKYIDSGLVVFENANNTKVCVNNMVAELTKAGATSQLTLLNNSIDKLKKLGVQVNYDCGEIIEDASTHECVFPSNYVGKRDDGSETTMQALALSQSVADWYTDQLAQMAEAGQTMPVSPYAWENYIYCYLVEDVTLDKTYPVPEGYKLVICKNGYELECEMEGEVYVYDCTPHVCVACGGCEMTAISNNALRALYSFSNEVFGETALVLPEGQYALMEPLDLTGIKLVIPADASITLCVNSFVDETKHVALENLIFEDEEQTNFSLTSCIYPIEHRHYCGESSPHITAVELGANGFAPYLNSNNEFITAGKGVEQAYALTQDIVLDAPIIVPSTAKIQICLNGYSITWTQQEKQGVGLFKVKYAAELTISDCSGGAGYVVAYPREDKNDTNITPVENFGTFTLNSGVLLGNIGVSNYGYYVMNGGTLNGVIGGILQNVATDDESPLHCSNPSMLIRGGVINGAYCAVASTTGDTTLKNAVLNTGLIGLVINGVETKTEIGNVTINVSETSTTALREMISKDFYDEISSEAANLLGTDFFVGVLLAGEVTVTGDITIEVEEAMLQPVVKEENGSVSLSYPTMTDICLLSNGALDVEDGVVFTDTYSVANSNNDSMAPVVNQPLDQVFIPAQGFASYVNENGELVILNEKNAGFMGAAQLDSYNFDLENGRIVFNFYCKFTEDFINNKDASVRIIYGDGKVDEFCVADGELLANGTYLYTVSFMAKDYQKNVKIQFNDGNHAWFGVGKIDPQYIWQNTIGATGISVKDYLESVIGFKEMYDEQYPQLVAAMNAYYEKMANLAEGETAPTPPLSEQEYQMLTEMGPYITEYAKVAEAMLAYCEAAAIQFGVEIEEEAKPIQPIATFSVVEEVGPETDEWTSVTAETLSAYKATVKEGSVMPAGLTMAGISLVLAADTDIRIYFTVAEGYSFRDYTITVNGEQESLRSYKKENQAFLLISGLSAAELKDMFTISISDGTNTYTFEYGAMSYMYTVLSMPSTEDSLKDVARAMWVYATRMEYFQIAMGSSANKTTV